MLEFSPEVGIFFSTQQSHSWYHKYGYGIRNKIENFFYRFKTITGNKLKSCAIEGQEIEADIG